MTQLTVVTPTGLATLVLPSTAGQVEDNDDCDDRTRRDPRRRRKPDRRRYRR